MAYVLELLQMVLTGSALLFAVLFALAIPAALYFGCPPAGVPFKGYYKTHKR